MSYSPLARITPTPHQRRHTSAASPHCQPPVVREATHFQDIDERAVCPICERPMMQCRCEFYLTLAELEADYCKRYPKAATYELQAQMELVA